MERLKLANTSFTKVVSALSVGSMFGSYTYVCIKSTKMVEFPQSFIVALCILLGVEVADIAKKKINEKKEQEK